MLGISLPLAAAWTAGPKLGSVPMTPDRQFKQDWKSLDTAAVQIQALSPSAQFYDDGLETTFHSSNPQHT